MNHSEQLKQWDILIRDGQASKVRSLCHKLNHKKIPRNFLVEYAQIARRVGASDLIILWLRPIVRPEKAFDQKASDSEKAVYGLGLLRLGAFREATQILNEIDPEKDPQIYFYKASLNINQWKYQKAIPELRKYIKHKAVPAYSKLVGRLNLCAALVTTQNFEQAELEISNLLKKLSTEKNSLLQGNLLEIRSQLLYQQGRLDEAIRTLELAFELLHKADERSLLYVQKWRLILQLKTTTSLDKLQKEFAELEKKASQIKDWETIRDCALQRSLVLKDKDLILKVYWGSKFSDYQDRALKLFGFHDVGESFVLNSALNHSAPVESIDLVQEAPTPILKKLFFVLTREFYQPLRMTEILDSLYDDEYYHPIASPAKLHRLIARAREWILEKKYPLEIKAYRNAFKIEFIGPGALLLTQSLKEKAQINLPQVTHQEFFRAQDWAQELQISDRTARHQILQLVQSGQIEMRRRGPKTTYRLKKNP